MLSVSFGKCIQLCHHPPLVSLWLFAVNPSPDPQRLITTPWFSASACKCDLSVCTLLSLASHHSAFEPHVLSHDTLTRHVMCHLIMWHIVPSLIYCPVYQLFRPSCCWIVLLYGCTYPLTSEGHFDGFQFWAILNTAFFVHMFFCEHKFHLVCERLRVGLLGCMVRAL